ncbi:MAG: hypothetical protein LDLANPLL_02248 [Turneriella sp.]|nr:hypothetical protein [Turneriella sp.]
MFKKKKNIALDAEFNEREYENIFLHNLYPSGKKIPSNASVADKVEFWALYDTTPNYNGIDLLRDLRTLWGIHLQLRIGPRSDKNSSPRGFCLHLLGENKEIKIFFEGYAGNISDATREPIAFTSFSNDEKSRALSQKYFIRFVFFFERLFPLQKIEAMLVAMSIAASLDKKRFAGIVDPDIFLFVPANPIRAGLANFLSANRLLNTHLVTGFNFFEKNSTVYFFTHGFNRFGFADILLSGNEKEAEELSVGVYKKALKQTHDIFLNHIMGNKEKVHLSILKNRAELPEQVNAMLGKKVLQGIYK